jgi:hypothetical protein
MDFGSSQGGAPASTGASSQGSGQSNVSTQTTQSQSNSTTGSNPNSHQSSQTTQKGAGTGDQGTQQQSSPKGTEPSSSEMYDVKINGRVMKMSRDQLIAHAQQSAAAQQRFEEASTIRKQVDKIISTAKENPIQALMDPTLGLSKQQIRDAFESWYMKEFVEPETLTPEQRAHKERDERLAQYEKTEKERLEQERRTEEDKVMGNYRDHYSKQIVEAMDKHGLPRTKDMAQRMAFYLRKSLQNGWEAPMELIVSQVREDQRGIVSNITEAMEVPQLIELLGEGVVKKIQKFYLEQLRTTRQSKPFSNNNSRGTGVQSDEKVYSSDVDRRLKDMRLGKF